MQQTDPAATISVGTGASSVVDAPAGPPKRRLPVWSAFFPGCLVTVCLCGSIASAGTVTASGRTEDVLARSGPIGRLFGYEPRAASPNPAAVLPFPVSEPRFAGLAAPPDPNASFQRAAGSTLPSDPRVLSARVEFGAIAAGAPRTLAAVWELVPTDGNPRLQQQTTFTLTQAMSNTAWWFSWRSDTAIPSGKYLFTLADVSDQGFKPVVSRSFDVRSAR